MMREILQRGCQSPTDLRPNDSRPLKLIKEFSGEPKDWTTWPKVREEQHSTLEYADAPNNPENEDSKVIRSNFDCSSVPLNHVQNANQGWVSVLTSCKGVVFKIVVERPASETWVKLV